MIDKSLKKGSDEYFHDAVRLIQSCDTKGEVMDILKEIWNDGKEMAKNEID